MLRKTKLRLFDVKICHKYSIYGQDYILTG